MLDVARQENSSGSGSAVVAVLDILKRLTAALHLLRLAEDAIPSLVSAGRTTADNAKLILGQIPALRTDIDQQVNAVKIVMNSIQDRMEVVAQFLLLHREALSRAQQEDLSRWLNELRG